MINQFKQFWKGGKTFKFQAAIWVSGHSISRNVQVIANSLQEAENDVRESLYRDFQNRDIDRIELREIK